jgi:hypothetical protein
METALAVLIILTAVLHGTLTIAHDFLSAQDTIMESWREMEERLGERARTRISVDEPATVDLLGYTVVVTLANEGSTKLADFDRWDVIAQYDVDNDGDHDIVEWLSYSEGDCYWSKDIGESFEPDILNPGEVMTITIHVSSEISTTGQAIIGTPNGITTSKGFAR